VYCLLGSKAEQCGDTNVDKMTLFQKPNGNDANLKATTAAAQMNDIALDSQIAQQRSINVSMRLEDARDTGRCIVA
jgi:hypothetical protein